MKIYNEIKMNIDSWEVLQEDSSEYCGPVTLCKSGGSTTTVDPAYNSILGSIAQDNQKWADLFMSQYFYADASGDPNEKLTGFYKDDGSFVDMTKFQNVEWVAEGRSSRGRSVDGEDLGIYLDPKMNVKGNPDLEGMKWSTKLKRFEFADGTPVSYTTVLRKDTPGYEESTHTSGAEYAQNSIDAQQSLLAGETSASASETALKGATADAALSLIPAQTDAALTTALLTTATNDMNRANVDQQGRTNLSGLLLEQETNDMNRSLVDPTQRAALSGLELQRETNDMNRSFIPLKTEVGKAFYDAALTGVDPNQRANQAQVDATLAFQNAGKDMRQQAALAGVNPNSGRFAGALANNSLDQAKAIGGARTAARTNAETENFSRLTTAMGGAQ